MTSPASVLAWSASPIDELEFFPGEPVASTSKATLDQDEVPAAYDDEDEGETRVYDDPSGSLFSGARPLLPRTTL
jgi:hypothetical protein